MIFHSHEIDRLNIYISKQFEKGKTLKVEPVTVSRSLSQNAYTWLVFTHIGSETGNTKDDIYQFCLAKFPVHKEIDVNGETCLIPVTLSGMNKEQNSHFIDQFVTFFRSEGYEVPEPEDKKTIDLYNFYKEKGML